MGASSPSLSSSVSPALLLGAVEAWAEPPEEDWESAVAAPLASALDTSLESALCESFCSDWVAGVPESPEPEPLTDKEQAPRVRDRARAAVPARTILGRRMMGSSQESWGLLYTRYNTG